MSSAVRDPASRLSRFLLLPASPSFPLPAPFPLPISPEVLPASSELLHKDDGVDGKKKKGKETVTLARFDGGVGRARSFHRRCRVPGIAAGVALALGPGMRGLVICGPLDEEM
ncbi:hypothetical protein C8R45DRAFT_1105095 [Mycena sanguinolenta]|nr:hypothetical protein C8R45DRAFT_1105095 [Mycena sanguinolenta]